MGVGARKRKLESTLYNSGLAFIVLGLWSSLKGYLMVYLQLGPEIKDYMAQMSASGEVMSAEQMEFVENFAFWLILALALVFVALVILLHFLIGRAAMKEAKGKKKGNAYLVLAVVFIVITIGTYVASFLIPGGLESVNLEDIIFDITLLFSLIMIFSSALRLRKTREEEADALAA